MTCTNMDCANCTDCPRKDSGGSQFDALLGIITDMIAVAPLSMHANLWAARDLTIRLGEKHGRAEK